MQLHGFLDFVIPEPKGRLHRLKEEENKKKKKNTQHKLVYTFETLQHSPPHQLQCYLHNCGVKKQVTEREENLL